MSWSFERQFLLLYAKRLPFATSLLGRRVLDHRRLGLGSHHRPTVHNDGWSWIPRRRILFLSFSLISLPARLNVAACRHEKNDGWSQWKEALVITCAECFVTSKVSFEAGRPVQYCRESDVATGSAAGTLTARIRTSTHKGNAHPDVEAISSCAGLRHREKTAGLVSK